MQTTTFKLDTEDVVKVANSVGINLSPQEVKEVIERYPDEQEQDPSGTWNLVVEHICHCIVADRED
jgi:hypothetical protein